MLRRPLFPLSLLFLERFAGALQLVEAVPPSSAWRPVHQVPKLHDHGVHREGSRATRANPVHQMWDLASPAAAPCTPMKMPAAFASRRQGAVRVKDDSLLLLRPPRAVAAPDGKGDDRATQRGAAASKGHGRPEKERKGKAAMLPGRGFKAV